MKGAAVKWLWTPAGLALAGILCLEPLAWGQLSRSGKVKGFKLPEFYEPIPGKVPYNRLRSLLTGAEAEPRSKDLVDVTQMRLETYQVDGRTNFIAKAPRCLVDLEQHEVSSSGRIEMMSGNGQLYLEGNEGFYCRMTNFTLVVSNRVRTVIRHGIVKEPKL